MYFKVVTKPKSAKKSNINLDKIRKLLASDDDSDISSDDSDEDNDGETRLVLLASYDDAGGDNDVLIFSKD